MQTSRPEPMLWRSDNRGVYIPRDFALSFADRAKSVANVDDEQWAILAAGPETMDNPNDLYWDVWLEVKRLSHLTLTHPLT